MDADNSRANKPFPYDELNLSDSLFLTEITEPRANSLRLIIREGRTSRIAVPIRIASTDLGVGFPVVIDSSCDTFALEWNNYVLYQVLNESFGQPALSSEVYEGRLARSYSASSLLQHVLKTSQARDEYPGKLLHFSIICEHHVIDVICVAPPSCLRSRLGSKLQ